MDPTEVQALFESAETKQFIRRANRELSEFSISFRRSDEPMSGWELTARKSADHKGDRRVLNYACTDINLLTE